MRGMMKTAAVVLLAGIALGCSSNKQGYQKAEVTSKRLTDTRKEVSAARAEVVNSVAALDALVNNPKDDLRPQFERFSKAVDSLENRAQRTRDRATDMRAKREAYITQWKAEADAITDPKMRERAYARMGEARQSFARLSDKSAAVREAAGPFMNHLQDLRRYLGADLTRGGIQSVTDLVAETRADEAKLLAAIDEMSAELDKISIDLSPVAPK